MSLWFVVHVNDQVIGACEVQRQERLDLSDLAVADAVSTYTVRLNGRTVGEVRHRYGNGAWPLLRAALNLAAETGETP